MSVSEKSLFARTNRNIQPKIHHRATTYSVQNSISDTLVCCPLIYLGKKQAGRLEASLDAAAGLFGEIAEAGPR